MKTRFDLIYGGPTAALMLLGATLVNSAPPEAKSQVEMQTTESNAVPKSIFTIPASFAQGRDPFFPNARYMFGAQAITKTPSSTPSTSLLVLNGISGTADHKLAIVNLRTMAEGETNEVSTAFGRVRIRCIEIRRESAVIEVIGGERRELHLRSGD
jgi:hypothetical protein